MKKIYKHTLEFEDLNKAPKQVTLPRYAFPIATAIQHGKIAVWFQVETEHPEIESFLASIGTGINFKDVGITHNYNHVGSILTHDGEIVHHIWFC